MTTIEQLLRPVRAHDLRELALLLVEAVENGAAVSFRAPLAVENAEAWWRQTLERASPAAIFLVARDEQGIAGTVQLHPAPAQNQPHRADIAKLIVRKRARGSGLGTRLMEAVENQARAAGLSLLTLDTKRGDDAERLYRRLGWIAAGVIPDYALDSDGTPHDTVVFYKKLA